MMNEARKDKIINNFISWIVEHDNEFIQAAIKAMDLTVDEAKELDLFDCMPITQYDLDLPDVVEVPLDILFKDDIPDSQEEYEEIINNFLSEGWGYCVEGYKYDTNFTSMNVIIKDIKWDIS